MVSLLIPLLQAHLRPPHHIRPRRARHAPFERRARARCEQRDDQVPEVQSKSDDEDESESFGEDDVSMRLLPLSLRDR